VITYKPYVQPGDAGPLGEADQMVIAWQTNEAHANPGAFLVEFGKSSDYGTAAAVAGRVVDNYLAADPTLPIPPTAPGPRVNYTAVLRNLDFSTRYHYRVTGPGLPGEGFTASFKTRTRSHTFSFLVQGDEGFFPAVPSSNPARIANYEARIVHLMFNAHRISLAGETARPEPNFALNTGDNVYTFGAEASYRDFWMPIWNSDTDSNETGAPFIRSKPFYIVIGNHDIGGSGDRVSGWTIRVARQVRDRQAGSGREGAGEALGARPRIGRRPVHLHDRSHQSVAVRAERVTGDNAPS
jgi:hypothetical protein